MAHYRAYVLGRDNSIQRAVDLDAEDDDQAAALAASMYPNDVIELWRGKRRVRHIEPTRPP